MISFPLSGKMDGDHRLDLLLLPFLLSREEKEVGLRCRSPHEIPNEPLTLTRRIKWRPKQVCAPIWTNPMKAKTSLCAYSAKLYEGQNNSLHLSDQTPWRPKQLSAPIQPTWWWSSPWSSFASFSSIKGRKGSRAAVSKPPWNPQRTSYAYQMNKMKAETTPWAYSSAPDEGQNNSLHLFGRTLWRLKQLLASIRPTWGQSSPWSFCHSPSLIDRRNETQYV